MTATVAKRVKRPMDKLSLSVKDRSESLEKLINLCHTHLFSPDGKAVYRYLTNERGLSIETVRKFKLGIFPRYADVVATHIGSYSAWKLGVIGFNDGGGILSKFSTHNVIIPIFDANDAPVAVIGRTLLPEWARQEKKLPKYTNSLFKKSQNLFGLNLAKDEIRKKDEVILVEGNFDVITAYQYGVKNVVAVSSSRLARMQLLLAARYARNAKLLLDNDEAGIAGTKKALEIYKNTSGISLSDIKLPADIKDIDEYLSSGRKISELLQ